MEGGRGVFEKISPWQALRKDSAVDGLLLVGIDALGMFFSVYYSDKPATDGERAFGDLRINKAQERLQLLKAATEKQLLLTPPAHYHRMKGTNRYSIDPNNRSSKWRITFSWEKDNLCNVELVKIEDTHQ